MSARLLSILAGGMIGLFLIPALVNADLSGRYRGDQLSIDIDSQGDGYTGTIHMGDQQFPFKAREIDGQLRGVFVTSSGSFDFVAKPQEDGLTLQSGDTTYVMKKINGINPLSGGKPAAASPSTQPTSDPRLPGYSIVSSTDSGKAMSVRKPNADSVQSALESTFPDLAKYFDARPAVSAAFEDGKDHRSGGASFSAKLRGQPVKGFVSCKLSESGATLAVVYCRADSPPSEWKKLTDPTPPAGSAAAAPEIKLQEYKFPDGTGSVGVADGWKTNAQTCMAPVLIEGEGKQTVVLGFCVTVVTPDSQMMQIQRQLAANARQMGMPPPPPYQGLVAPYTSPADALANLVPQLDAISRRNHGPGVHLDQILDQQKTKANLPNGRAALVSYLLTKVENGQSTPYRALAQIEVTPTGAGAWMFYAVEFAAPRKTFEKDYPVMLAMAKSLQTDDRVVQEKTRANIDAQNQRFAAMQEAHRQQVASFDSANKAWERRETIQARSAADFDEVIRGYRTVEDTETGERGSVDLGNSHEIVNNLNRFDPGRYKEIPLRDDVAPLPKDR